MLFHVTDGEPPDVMRPRPSPAGTPHAARLLVWAVDEEHLVNYLLPRDCPRVTWAAKGVRAPLLGSAAARVVVVEHAWAARLLDAGLTVMRLDPTGFTELDSNAGYWVSETDAQVLDTRRVDDCFEAIASTGAELRLTENLWPYIDAVTAAAPEFSVIRKRNAHPR